MINPKIMRRLYSAPISYFERYGERFNNDAGKKFEEAGTYFYRDNGSSVLAVAHLDWVGEKFGFAYAKNYMGVPVIWSPAHDDRLGVYTILHALPELGINVDVLLTTGEECGHSSAQYFKTEKRYNWLVEFDRRGENVVLYGYSYKAEAWETALKAVGYDIQCGSFSDIAEMYPLGIKGVNVGVGYHDEHTPMCFVDLDEYKRQILRFCVFYDANVGTRFEHETPPPPPPVTIYKYDGMGYGDYSYPPAYPNYYDDDPPAPLEKRAYCCAVCRNIYDVDGVVFPNHERAVCIDCAQEKYTEDKYVTFFDEDGRPICKLCEAIYPIEELAFGLCETCLDVLGCDICVECGEECATGHTLCNFCEWEAKDGQTDNKQSSEVLI